ncbi:GSK-3-binding protein-like [Cygnus atratus]|uniref:GSK-3-binding protein-like n=1 Tax=Cygnus atratus TaxID=8868 RepID=UPI0015D65166|nr:GSK-3-binding protein-like [Cygnus atratus]
MPCRPGERFVLLERPAAAPQAGPKEVDALVAKLGEVLQLSAQHRAPRGAAKHPGPGSARDRAAPYSPRCPSAAGVGGGCGAPVQPPPPPPRLDGSGRPPRVAKQLCGRGWLRSAARRRKEQRQRQQQQQRQRAADGPAADGPAADEEDDDDPHRLLQQLILSGNLIKEAVRRLQLAVAASSASSSASSASSSSAASGGGGEALRALQ